MKKIFTEDAPAPAGHYSQAVVSNNLVFVSGQLPIVPGSSDRTVGSMQVQAGQVLNNMQAILQAAGTDIDHVVKVTIYVSDIDQWGAVNDVYSEFFGEHKPARAIVPVNDLHYGYQIELEAVAAMP